MEAANDADPDERFGDWSTTESVPDLKMLVSFSFLGSFLTGFIFFLFDCCC